MESVNTHIISKGSPHDAIEKCYERGWTDGLPVVPPTPERVAALLDFVGLGPKEILGEVPVRSRSLTAEQAGFSSRAVCRRADVCVRPADAGRCTNAAQPERREAGQGAAPGPGPPPRAA